MRLRSTVGILCLLLGGGLVAAATVTLFRQDRKETEAGDRAEALLSQIQQAVFVQRETAESEVPAGAESVSTEAAVPVASMGGHDCAGLVEFPTLSLELPVLADCSETLLETAPCRQYGTADGDDLVIAGHNYRRHFKRLRDLVIGDAVIFTDISGRRHCYTVAALEVLNPDDLEKMLSGDWPLSLYTCTAGGKRRLTVRCVRDGG